MLLMSGEWLKGSAFERFGPETAAEAEAIVLPQLADGDLEMPLSFTIGGATPPGTAMVRLYSELDQLDHPAGEVEELHCSPAVVPRPKECAWRSIAGATELTITSETIKPAAVVLYLFYPVPHEVSESNPGGPVFSTATWGARQ
jgi:hypothetical protein